MFQRADRLASVPVDPLNRVHFVLRAKKIAAFLAGISIWNFVGGVFSSLCLTVVLCSMQLRADVTGSIIGYVRDKSGAVLPNANLTAVQTTTGYKRTATSDASGQYSILALPPGRYKLTARERWLPAGNH